MKTCFFLRIGYILLLNARASELKFAQIKDL